ncbi:MAG: tetratricopeptide repeat protein [Myxococcales bacterium]|nr:tetratricopeptide repeat protein [Myxococcales bacterium]
MLELRCPRCNAPQTLAEAPTAGEAVRVACLTCGAVFRVRGRSKTASALIDGRAPPPLPDDGDALGDGATARDGAPRWQVRKADGTALQFPNLRVFQRWVVDGVVSLDDAISRNGRTWRPITAIPELVGLFERVEALKGATAGGHVPPALTAMASSDPPELPPPELPPPELPPDVPAPPEPPPVDEPSAPSSGSDAPEPAALDEPDSGGPNGSGIDSTLQDLSLAEIRAGLAMDFGDFKASSVDAPAPQSAPEPEILAPLAPVPLPVPESLGPSTSELSDYLASAYGESAPAESSPQAARSEGQADLGPWTAGDDLAPVGSASDIQKLRESPPDESELIGSTLQMRLPDMRVARTATPVPFLEPEAVIASVPPPPKRLWLLAATLLALSGAGFATWWFVIRESPSQAESATPEVGKVVAPAPAATPAPSEGAPGPKAHAPVEPHDVATAPEPKAAEFARPTEIETRRGALSAIDTATPTLAKVDPKVAEPKAAEPKVAEPKVAEPKVAEPKVTEPKAAEPKVAEPKVAEPKVVEPKVAEPNPPSAEGADPYDTAISEASAAQKSGNLAGALAALERAASLNPKTVEPIAKMGWIHLSMGNASQAIVRFQEAKRRNPGYRDTYLGLAKAYEADGRRDEAIDVYRNYLRLCATSKCRQADAVKAALTRLGAGP